MKLRQTVRHVAAKRALSTPVLGDLAADWLVDLHVRVFLRRADPEGREARRDRLEALFDCTTDAYLAALEAGYPEAEAREITHVQANLDFANHGWTEMLEIPLDELDPHLDRYADFFAAHGVTREDPLGDFRSRELPDAPATPERLAAGEAPRAVAGYADDAYVERDGDVGAGGERTDGSEASSDGTSDGDGAPADPAAVLGLEDDRDG